jgi:hypothetical protein
MGADFRNQMLTMFRIIGFLLLVYLLLHLRLLSVKLGMLRRRIVNMCDCARLGAMLVLLANGRRGLSRRLRKKLPRERKKYVFSFLGIVRLVYLRATQLAHESILEISIPNEIQSFGPLRSL